MIILRQREYSTASAKSIAGVRKLKKGFKEKVVIPLQKVGTDFRVASGIMGKLEGERIKRGLEAAAPSDREILKDALKKDTRIRHAIQTSTPQDIAGKGAQLALEHPITTGKIIGSSVVLGPHSALSGNAITMLADRALKEKVPVVGRITKRAGVVGDAVARSTVNMLEHL